MPQLLYMTLCILALAGVAFTSAAEAALIATPVQTPDGEAAPGDARWQLLRKLRSSPIQNLAGLLVSHAVLSMLGFVFLGLVAADGDLGPRLRVGNVYLLVQLLFCEIIAKGYGLTHAAAFGPRVAPVIRLMALLFFPIGWLCGILSQPFGVRSARERPGITTIGC